MKKTVLILLGTVSCLQAEQVTPPSFNGFYVGAQIGAVRRTDTTDYKGETVTLPTLGVPMTLNALHKSNKHTGDWSCGFGESGFLYGVFSGYGRNLGGTYLGIEEYIEYSAANKKNTYDISGNVSGTIPLTGKLETKYERGCVFGLAPRIGVVFDQTHLVYAKLGIEISRDKAKGRVIDLISNLPGSTKVSTDEKSKNKTQLVFVPGFGYEKVWKHFIARIEYGFNFGGKININDVSSIKYSAHILKFGFAWKI